MDVREYDKVSRYILHIEFKLGRGGAGNSPRPALNPRQGVVAEVDVRRPVPPAKFR